jgi:4-hydroxy-tetrahydrodipicolinate reductase
MTIRTLHLGLGPIGLAVARQVATRPGLRIVGAVDIDAAKVGRDLGAFLNLQPLRVKVSDDLAQTIEKTRPHIAILCTGSSLERVQEQFATVLKLGVPIVSTTEELAFPVGPNQKIAKKLDALARENNVALLGTGVNPGFAMDALPIALSAVCERVDSIRVDRVQNASPRRQPFQAKIGASLSPAEFEAKVQRGAVCHVGLAESITMIATAMNWKLDNITDEIVPKVANKAVSSEFFVVKKGAVCGLIQDGIGYVGGAKKIELHMEAYLGAPNSFERVRIQGSPPLDMRIDGGIPGDIATASVVVNSIPKVLSSAPGLKTMLDLALMSFWGTSMRKTP